MRASPPDRVLAVAGVTLALAIGASAAFAANESSSTPPASMARAREVRSQVASSPAPPAATPAKAPAAAPVTSTLPPATSSLGPVPVKPTAAPAKPATASATKPTPTPAPATAAKPAATPPAVAKGAAPATTPPAVGKATGVPAKTASATATTTKTPVGLTNPSKPVTGTPTAVVDEHVTYHYITLGRRDPFQSLVDGEFVGVDVGGDAPPDVGGMTVVGIVWGDTDKFALVEDGRGNSHVLRQGDKVMNGFVEGLKRDAMMVSITVDGQTETVTVPLTRRGDGNANR